MRKKETNNQTKVKGFYINELTRGFLGDQNEGQIMLKKMGLPIDTVPFSVAIFLQNQKIFWMDKNGNKATISFKLKPNQLECFGTYLKKRKSMRLFREWGNHEDPEVIARLESEAIGDCCMRCIYENLIE
ncbi:hypothetical protein [Prevotella sp. MGM2]|uniref:hypothetical protein n=1 Tax=Prevotella sp. MGM2 TaxID=2033406 RepID=UPI000CE9CE3F|nr:hypothetical protein [Prevotella sp. MGM2]GAY29918.1 hypothetical protein PvtlMGM2_0771 [Prevotella sp. MGM2]